MSETRAPTACPACDFVGIRYSGLGTQRLEAEVRARFPNIVGPSRDDICYATSNRQAAVKVAEDLGGPEVEPPKRTGFGSTVIQKLTGQSV